MRRGFLSQPLIVHHARHCSGNSGSSSGPLCRPPVVPCALPPLSFFDPQPRPSGSVGGSGDVHSHPPKLTNAMILKAIAGALGPLRTAGRGASSSSSVSYGSGEVSTLDSSVDAAAWRLVHRLSRGGEGGSGPTVASIPSVGPSPPYMVRSGGISMSGAELDAVHAALSAASAAVASDTTRNSREMAAADYRPLVIGCDEAGRGPLAGPVVCAAYGRVLQTAPLSPFLSSSPASSLSGADLLTSSHSVTEIAPAMDSKAFPASERWFAFGRLAAGDSAVPQPLNAAGCLRRAVGALRATAEKDGTIGDDADPLSPPTATHLPQSAVSFFTVTNPTAIDELGEPIVASSFASPTSQQQALVPLPEPQLSALLAEISCAGGGDGDNEKCVSLELLLRAAARKGHPPLVATVAFSSLLALPANSPAASPPPTIGDARAAVRSFEEAAKAGQKALIAAGKKEAKALAKAAKDAEKKAAKEAKALAKARAKAAKSGTAIPSPPPSGEALAEVLPPASAPENSAASSSPSQQEPHEWQPDGLHPTLAALWDASARAFPHASSQDDGGGAHAFMYKQHGAVAIVNSQFIDATNILAASMHGMAAAATAVAQQIAADAAKEQQQQQVADGTKNEFLAPVVLIDGSAVPGDLAAMVRPLSSTCTSAGASPVSVATTAASFAAAIPVTKGDSTSHAIGAASLLAKSVRDAVMTFYGSQRMFPQYGFAAHEGYPCATHRAAIEAHGLSPIHRRTYGPCRVVLQHKKTDDGTKG